MAEEFSPEEKLLRLIRGEKRHKDKPVPEKAESPKSPKVESSKNPAETSLTGIRNTKHKLRTTLRITNEWRYFKFLNSALIIILIITIGFFIFGVVSSNLKQSVIVPQSELRITNHEVQPTTHQPQTAGREAQTTPFSTYAEVIGRRELFKPQKSEAQTKKASDKKLETAYDKLKDLSLIGIIAGEKPQVVIEDKKNQKTYFLYKGQTVNQMKVEEILEDMVILDFEGEKFELTL